jgi:uncharacterized membrane protein YphA (DoxX/SURF4 family)
MKLKLSTIIAIGLFLVFAYAGVIKALQPSLFYDAINRYHLISESTAWYLAHYLSWLEIIIAFACLHGRTRGAACLIMACLLLIFMVVLTSAWLRKFHSNCGCLGATLDPHSIILDIGRDCFLFLCAIYLFRQAARLESSASLIPQG